MTIINSNVPGIKAFCAKITVEGYHAAREIVLADVQQDHKFAIDYYIGDLCWKRGDLVSLTSADWQAYLNTVPEFDISLDSLNEAKSVSLDALVTAGYLVKNGDVYTPSVSLVETYFSEILRQQALYSNPKYVQNNVTGSRLETSIDPQNLTRARKALLTAAQEIDAAYTLDSVTSSETVFKSPSSPKIILQNKGGNMYWILSERTVLLDLESHMGIPTFNVDRNASGYRRFVNGS